MKRLFLILSLIVALAAPVWAELETKTITIAADEWCPINCNPNDTQLGIGIDVAKKIFEPLGYKINYVIMPWARALAEVKAGKIDAVVGANSTDDPTLVFPRSPVHGINDSFFVRKEDPWEFKTIDSLKGRHIGIIKDYGYDEALTKFIEEQHKIPGMIQEVSGDDGLGQNIQKLLAGRIDVVVESRIVMDYTLARLNLADKVRWAGAIPQESVYVAFSPALAESKKHAEQFDAGVARLKKAGTLHTLYEAYGLTPP